MPVDDLGKLGMRMRAARNEMGLTQQRLSDMCHVSIQEIAKIENGEMNPSFLILKAIIQVLHNSLDSLIISDGSADEGAEQMKMLYLSCPPEMQETLLNNTKRLTEELISLLFTRSVNIISVISKIEYIQEASPQIFLCLSSVFLKKVTKKEQGIDFYIPCSVRSILANVLIK